MCLPIPEDEEAPWWPTLAVSRAAEIFPSVLDCPLLDCAANGDSALYVASIAPDESGDDELSSCEPRSQPRPPERCHRRCRSQTCPSDRQGRSDGRHIGIHGGTGRVRRSRRSPIARLTDPDNGIAESVIFLVSMPPFSSDDIADRESLMVLPPDRA